MSSNLPPNSEELIRDLPDAEEAARFLRSFVADHAASARLLTRDQGLLADALALAAWSPFLGATINSHPEHLPWLARERKDARVRTAEELADSLARFAATNTTVAPAVLLARFRRRELLRIYLRDIRRTATLVETTEELSNLADAALSFALDLARQELDNLYGAPLCTDARGRTSVAGFCIIALGKLGSRELNYASDIDLLFLYSDDGSTAGTGARGSTTNREYFVRLATRVSAIVGGTGAAAGGEAAAYRVDLRLRPHGRDGVLAPSVAEAARYYCERAQSWERQVLIRARTAAGSDALFDEFDRATRDAVYHTATSVAGALAGVRASKSKIDEQHGERGTINVKLGRGGIREIEFIAQALQLAYGAADEWLRAAHTLQSLARLADRRLIADAEHAALSAAYDFLRRVEHRAQMEHGLQTHSVPADDARRLILAGRCGFDTDDALADFDRTLDAHRANVRGIYDRVFAAPEGDDEHTPRETFTHDAAPTAAAAPPYPSSLPERIDETPPDPVSVAAAEFDRHLIHENGGDLIDARTTLAAALRDSSDERRAYVCLTRVAASLAKSDTDVKFDSRQLAELVRLCDKSDYFADLIANHPRLISALPAASMSNGANDANDAATEETNREAFGKLCRERMTGAGACGVFGEALACLRSAWAESIIRVGADDAGERITFREANRRQTMLAVASIDAACQVATRELAARHNGGRPLAAEARLAILGLGRLGGGGMDYGSDLDLVLVFDERRPSPLPDVPPESAYSLYAEILVAALSSLTRDGSLYRVDLRLRPDGANGRSATSRASFTKYLRERAAAWELLAYVKLHASAGDKPLGVETLEAAHAAMRERAARLGADVLRTETRRVRERLEHERSKVRARGGGIDFKHGTGGMLDVYFAARFLQLRDGIREDNAADRTTTATLARLRDAGALSDEDWQPLSDGYALLRRLDHALRLTSGRGARLPLAADAPALARLARRTGHDSPAALLADLRTRMTAIRVAFDRVTS